MNIYGNMRTADIVAEASIDWNLNFIFGLYGNGINGFIEALRQCRISCIYGLVYTQNIYYLLYVIYVEKL
jgi:hypothetical protein